MLIRRIHAYLAVFVAPAVLFFALTGALQLFGLHEAHDGYQPPSLIQGLARLHKDQVFDQPRSPSSQRAEDGDRARSDPDATRILKWFFFFVTAALSCSTGLGLWLGLRTIRHRPLSWFLLSCGTAVPIVLAILTRTS